MRKLSEEAKKRIAEAVKRSWVLRRQRAAAKAQGGGAVVVKRGSAKAGRRRLSAEAKKRIAEAVRRSWIARRAGRVGGAGKVGRVAGGHGILAAIDQASNALRSLTLDDLRPLAGRRDAVARLDDLATLASDLKRLIAP